MMNQESLKHNTDDQISQSLDKLPDYLEETTSDDEEITANHTLSKLEREALFNEAENMRLEGRKSESADLYMRCLFSLEVKTAFPSLPRCLRALSNFFLEKKQYVKAIHFVQAERLYYESALMDTATLQQKLTDITTGNLSADDIINSPIAEMCLQDIENSKTRLLEYHHLIMYFKDKNDLKSALEYTQKSIRLSTYLYGSDSAKGKESLSTIQLLANKITQEKTYFDQIGDAEDPAIDVSEDEANNQSPKKLQHSMIFHRFLPDMNGSQSLIEGDKDHRKTDAGVTGPSQFRDISDYTERSTRAQVQVIGTAPPSAIKPVVMIVTRFILICVVFILVSTATLTVLYNLVISLAQRLFPGYTWAHGHEIMTDNNLASRQYTDLLRGFISRVYRIMSQLLSQYTR